MIRTLLVSATASLGLMACAHTATVADDASPINTANMSETAKVLSSDEFLGRAPGTEGETKTVEYLIQRFTDLGLEPGGRDGKWTDPVTLKHSVITDVRTLNVSQNGAVIPMKQARDIEISSPNPSATIKVENAPVVFVGFGPVRRSATGMISATSTSPGKVPPLPSPTIRDFGVAKDDPDQRASFGGPARMTS